MKRGIGKLTGLAVLGVFGAAALWVWVPQAAAPTSVTTAPAVDLAARVQMMDERLSGFIAVTTERPLFDATRRPPTAEAPEAPATPQAEPTLTLVGVLGDGNARLALVRTSTSPQLYRLETGARLDRWEVLEIGPSSIRVRKDDNAEEILRIGQ